MTTGTITEPHDDDVLLVFRRGQEGMRRKSERMSWKDAKAAIMAALPDSPDAIEEIRLQIDGVGKAANDAILAAARVQADALRAEATACSDAIAAEAKTRGDADMAEAKARAAADADLAARQTIVQGVMVIPAGLAILAGKMPRTAAVAGIKAGENFNLTFRGALPAGLTQGECYSVKDGEVTIILLAIGPATISAKVDCPFTVAILRPPAT